MNIGYHQKLYQTFKTIPSRIYDMTRKRWNFLLEDHDKLIAAIQPFHPEVYVHPIPKNVLNILKKASVSSSDDIDLSRQLDPFLHNALMEFQKEGVCFGIQRDGRVLIADDMGLGKTIQAIAIASYYKNEWPLLVVTPSSLRYTWLEAFTTWVPSLSREKITVVNSGKETLNSSQVYIISYDLVSRRQKELESKEFRVVIADECHFLKSFKAIRTKACTAIMKGAWRVILLSGTPALSRPIELLTQIHLINRSLFPNFTDFGIRYCDGKKNYWGWDFMGASNTQELFEILKDRIMIRRMKSEVMHQLPQKQRQVIILDPNSVKSNEGKMKFYAKEMIKDLKGSDRKKTLIEYFAETGEAKAKAVCDYVGNMLESECKFLCFAHHRVILDAVTELLVKKHCNFIRIDGGTPPEMRKNACDKFQMDETCKVAVLSITATNTGLTLTAAHMVVIAELFWNPGVLLQAEDRVHRIGQEDCVLIRYLVAKRTADDYLWELIQKKLKVLNKVGLSKENYEEANAHKMNYMGSSQATLEDFSLDLNADDFFEDMHEGDSCNEVKRCKMTL